MGTGTMTYREALDYGASFLSEKGLADPSVEAEWLLAEVSGKGRTGVHLSSGEMLEASAERAYREGLGRRAEGEPLAYIVGRQPFRGLVLEVGPGVFIPRPETELLAGLAIDWLRARLAALGTRLLAVDVGTGSGAIALSIAAELTDEARQAGVELCVAGIDASREALDMAELNGRGLGLDGSVTFLEGDLLDPLKDAIGPASADIIVSNPPYVADSEMGELQREVRCEPLEALTPGTTGIELYPELAGQSMSMLADGGALMLEVGRGQADEVAAVLQREGFGDIHKEKDLAGIERIVWGTKL